MTYLAAAAAIVVWASLIAVLAILAIGAPA